MLYEKPVGTFLYKSFCWWGFLSWYCKKCVDTLRSEFEIRFLLSKPIWLTTNVYQSNIYLMIFFCLKFTTLHNYETYHKHIDSFKNDIGISLWLTVIANTKPSTTFWCIFCCCFPTNTSRHLLESVCEVEWNIFIVCTPFELFIVSPFSVAWTHNVTIKPKINSD